MNKKIRLPLIFTLLIYTLYSSNLKKFTEETHFWPEFRGIDDKIFIHKIYKESYTLAKSLKNYQETPRIPKIIHQIWLGSPVPRQFLTLMNTWIKHHPDWKYILWTDENIKAIELFNQEAFDLAKNYGMKSDILRLELLYQFGGLYIDLDQECIVSHDIFHHICDFYLGFCHNHEFSYEEMANGVMGSVKNHEILLNAINSISLDLDKIKNMKNNDKSLTMDCTGPFLIKREVNNYLKNKADKNSQILPLILPKPFFYPIECKARNLKQLRFFVKEAEKKIKPYTYGIQYHTCTWQK